MKVSLPLFCFIAVMSVGCKQAKDPFAFDTIVNTAYSNLTNTTLLDSASQKAQKEKDLKLRNLKKECKKLDSCVTTEKTYIKVM